MGVRKESKLVNTTIELRKHITGSRYGIEELQRIFICTSVVDYLKQDAALGGYVPHQKKLRKKNYFV
ncbi:MAG: hypothetical protein R3Y24_10485 [Eubacteriales bacterium]